MIGRLFGISLLLFITLWPGFVFASEVDESNSFSLGVIPQQAAKKIHDTWTPFTTYIKQQTNYPFYIYGSPDIPTFENRLFTGKFDLAYVNPRLFLEAAKHVGYLPLAKEGDKQLKGIIVVAKDSPYKTIKDLMNARFVSPKNAFAASALTRLNLQSQGMLVSNRFVKTHTQGYALVVKGAVDAAGGVSRTFESLAPEIKSKLRVLWESDGVNPHALIIHPRVNAKVKERILDAILDFKTQPEGRLFYEGLKMNPFIPAESSDWDDVRKLIDQ